MNGLKKLLGHGNTKGGNPPKYNPWIHDGASFERGQKIGTERRKVEHQNGLNTFLKGGDLKGARKFALGGGNMQAVEDIDGMIGRMNEQQLAETNRKAGLVAGIVQPLLSVPEAERQKHAMQVQRELKANGFSDAEIAQVDLTDVGIEQDLNIAMGLEKRLAGRSFATVGDETVMRDTVTGTAASAYTAPPSYADTTTRQNNDADNVREDDKLAETIRHNQAARQEANAPRDLWQSAGNGAIFNPRTGEIQRAQPQGGGSMLPPGLGGPQQNPRFHDTNYSDDGMFIKARFGGEEQFQGEQEAPRAQGEAYQAPDQQMNASQYQKYAGSEFAKADTKAVVAARDTAAEITRDLLPQLEMMESLIDQGMQMGPGANVRQAIGEWVPGADMIPAVPDKAERERQTAFKALATKLTLDIAKQGKGAMSDGDREWFRTTAPQLTNESGGAKAIIETSRAAAKRQQEYAKAAEIWTGHMGGLSIRDGDGKSFHEAWAQYADENPIRPPQIGGSGLSAEKQARLDELRAKQAAGTLQ